MRIWCDPNSSWGDLSMFLRPTLGALPLLLALTSLTPAQAPDPRAVLREPKTPAEFFDRVKFEMDLGNYPGAAQYLTALVGNLTKMPDEERTKALLALEKAEGTTAFLKLRNVPRWIDPPPATANDATKKAAANQEAQAKKAVEDLIKLVTDTVRANLQDADRLRKFVGRLPIGKEEYDYAMTELYRSGATVVPYILDELRTADGERRVAFLKALTQLGPEATAPIIAGLDANLPAFQLDLIGVLRKRNAREAIPSLYWILGNSASPPALRDAARDTLIGFTVTPADRLPSPRTALTDEAEKFYQHKVAFVDPKAVVIWRWDPEGGGRVVQGFKDAPTIPASKAEEYFGTKYATQALALDPAYFPAQVVLTSLILEKNYEEAGPWKSLAETRPNVHQRLAALKPELLTAVLERGLNDNRALVVLGALRLLGDQGEIQANRPGPGGQPPLVRALDFPDARVQLAAAETQLKLPGPVHPAIAVRVIDILKRALAADAINKKQARVLIGYFDDGRLVEVVKVVRDAGHTPIPLKYGRALLRRLQEASDIDAVVLDADLPDPGLPNFLAQMKADRNARNLPIILTSELANYDRWRFYVEKNSQVRGIIPLAHTLIDVRTALTNLLRVRERERQQALADARFVPVPDWAVLSEDEIRWLGELLPALRERERNRPSRDVDLFLLRDRVQRFLEEERKRAVADGSINAAFQPRPLTIEELRDAEVRMVRERLNQLLNRDPAAPTLNAEEIRRLLASLNQVIAASTAWAIGAADSARISTALDEALAAPDHKPLSPEEVQDHAERAIRALAKLARKEVAGYDVRPAEVPVYEVLRSNRLSAEGRIAAIAVVGAMTGNRPQPELLAALTNAENPKEVRVAAAETLVKHIQQYGLALRPNDTAVIGELAVDPKLDPAVRSSVTALLGALNPSNRLSGERLQGYQPSITPPPMKEK